MVLIRHAYFIPTNRKIKKCINSYVKEVIYAKEKFGIDMPIIIVETNNEESVQVNQEVLRKLANTYKDLKIMHLTLDVQKKYFDMLFKDIEHGKTCKNFF